MKIRIRILRGPGKRAIEVVSGDTDLRYSDMKQLLEIEHFFNTKVPGIRVHIDQVDE